jgi:hypothetical protein
VGSTQFIPARPARKQIEEILAAAADASRSLGWRNKAA